VAEQLRPRVAVVDDEAHLDVEGSGLGLAIATRAAARAGGTLALERSGDGETVFGLRLPLHVAAGV
jgi:signal transduction histidine kinase